jgi:pimeloyl-ACP methyl ester carboxylesterase
VKTKILAGLLTVSVLLNIAGLVFFIAYLKTAGTLKTVKRERALMAQNLTAVRAEGLVTEALESGQVVRRTFCSLVDGQEDWYALMPPAVPGKLDNTLVVYLHGMGSTYLEPFTCPQGTTIAQAISNKYPDVCLLSCNYRKESSWGSDEAMSDITQNIRAVLQQFPIKRIVLMGTSMGGCTVLSYAVQAPADIKEKLAGIVSVEGAGSLKKLYDLTDNRTVKGAIAAAMGGTYENAAAMYQRKSFLPNITGLPKSVRVAIVSARLDHIVPPALQDDLLAALQSRHYRAKLLPVDAAHGAPPAPVYVKALDFAING